MKQPHSGTHNKEAAKAEPEMFPKNWGFQWDLSEHYYLIFISCFTLKSVTTKGKYKIFLFDLCCS